jgi:hypothetical protein
MKTIMRAMGLVLPILVAFALTPGGWSTTVSAGEEPTEVTGFGEAKAVPSIKVNGVKGDTRNPKSFGKKSLGAIGDTVGHRFTFAFGATKDANGKVTGQMFLRDHDMNMTVSSDIAVLKPHPKHRDIVGVKARGLNYVANFLSSKTSVFVNGKPQPGWQFRAWGFDGDKDVVCISLRPPGKKKNAYNWVGYLSSGDMRAM